MEREDRNLGDWHRDDRQRRPRHCARPACDRPAAAALSYDYAARTVWIGDLGETTPACHDLCRPHADRLRVPRGWTKNDVRLPPTAVADRERDVVSMPVSLAG